MSTDWKGMNVKRTPVHQDATLAQLSQNQRYRISGELQRRPGLAASSLTKLGDPIISMWQGADFGDYIITQAQGTLIGDRSPNMRWGETAIKPPIIIRQDPACASGGSNTVNVSTTGAMISGTIGPFDVTAGCCYRLNISLTVTVSDPANTWDLVYSGITGGSLLLAHCGGATLWDSTVINNIATGGTTYNYVGFLCSIGTSGAANISYSIAHASFGSIGIVGGIRMVSYFCPGCC